MVTATATTRNFVTRPLTAADLPDAHALSQAVRWPHRLEDWQFVLPLGIGLAVEDQGVLVGTGLYWPLGTDFATLGLVIVSPERQGAGIGRRLMDGLLHGVGDRAVLLNATEAGMPLYEKLGFRAIGRVNQHQGDGFTVPSGAPREGDRVRALERGDEAAVMALDARATGLPRGHVIAALREVADGVVLERDGEVAGFALCRRFGRGHVAGPVVAPDAEGAQALIGHWMAVHRGRFLRIDMVEATGLSGWLADHGLPPIAHAITMVRGKAPEPAGTPRLFTIINQAIG